MSDGNEAAKVGTLDVPGARIHYEARGRGPVLLVLQGGAGGAEGAHGLAAQLKDRFTVVGYDRRGLSKSPLTAPAQEPWDLRVHADDAARLLAALTKEPAFVLGVSIGAMIGLDLVTRYPHQVQRLIAFEPPVVQLLEGEEQAAAERLGASIAQAFRTDGPMIAMRKFADLIGVVDDEREPEVQVPKPSPERAANFQFFLSHDHAAVRRYVLEVEALRKNAARITPAIGTNSLAKHRKGEPGAIMKAAPVLALAKTLGVSAVEFPGGHGGYVSVPRAFSARLAELLSARAVSGHPTMVRGC